MEERALFLTRSQYTNGHTYWHGFADMKAAEECRRRGAELDVDGTVYFGVATLSPSQAAQAKQPKGCIVEQVQLSKFLREV